MEISDCRSLLFDPPCRNPVKSVPCGKAIWKANGGFVSVLLTHLFYCMFVCLFGQRFLSNPLADSRQILHAGVAWVGTCLLPFWGSATPWGGKKWGNDMGVVSFVHRTATISIFLSDAKCSPICRAQTCAHYGAEPPRSAKGFLQGGPKSSKKFRIFHHFETLRPYISETIRNSGI